MQHLRRCIEKVRPSAIPVLIVLGSSLKTMCILASANCCHRGPQCHQLPDSPRRCKEVLVAVSSHISALALLWPRERTVAGQRLRVSLDNGWTRMSLELVVIMVIEGRLTFARSRVGKWELTLPFLLNLPHCFLPLLRQNLQCSRSALPAAPLQSLWRAVSRSCASHRLPTLLVCSRTATDRLSCRLVAECFFWRTDVSADFTSTAFIWSAGTSSLRQPPFRPHVPWVFQNNDNTLMCTFIDSTYWRVEPTNLTTPSVSTVNKVGL